MNNAFNGMISSRLDKSEGRISEPEDRTTEITKKNLTANLHTALISLTIDLLSFPCKKLLSSRLTHQNTEAIMQNS